MISANVSRSTRRAVYRRDGYACAICDSTRYLQIHHAVARSNGGNNREDNLITLCDKCHALAHGLKLDDSDMTQGDMEFACVEYLADLYARSWNPYSKEWWDKMTEYPIK